MIFQHLGTISSLQRHLRVPAPARPHEDQDNVSTPRHKLRVTKELVLQQSNNSVAVTPRKTDKTCTHSVPAESLRARHPNTKPESPKSSVVTNPA